MAKTPSAFTGLAILRLCLAFAHAPAFAQTGDGPAPNPVGDPASVVVAVTNTDGTLQWFTRSLSVHPSRREVPLQS